MCQGILCFFSFNPSGPSAYGAMLSILRIDLPSLDESLWHVPKDTLRWAFLSSSISKANHADHELKPSQAWVSAPCQMND